MVRARSAKNRATPTQSIVRVIRESDPNTSGIGPRNATPPHRRVGARPSARPAPTCSLEPAPVRGGQRGEGRKNPTKNKKKARNASRPPPAATGTLTTGEPPP